MDNALINRRFGPYILLKRLAVGGMAEIFLALRLGPGPVTKLLVLKCILQHCNEDRDFVRLFYREAQLSCLLQHPNMINVWAAEQIAGRHTMSMEYLRGVTLDAMIARSRELGIKIPIEVAVWLIANACDGLQYLHSLRSASDKALHAVHRDISPQNIFACYDGQIKLFDFGVAQFGDTKQDPHKGMLVGKYAYMSPEQCSAQSLDVRSDIFSLAVVLYELTTGVALFQKDNDIMTLEAVRRCAVSAPSEIDTDFAPFLEIVLMKALNADPGMRYQSDEEFSEDLRKFLKISGYKQTSEALHQFLAEIFANEIANERALLKHSVKKAEELYGRTDPLEALCEADDPFCHCDELLPESEDIEEYGYLNSAGEGQMDITLSRIASLKSLSQATAPQSDLAPTSMDKLHTPQAMQAQSAAPRAHFVMLIVGIVLGVALGIGILAMLSAVPF